eukprot:c45827_g1_i1 orf=89-253(+)
MNYIRGYYCALLSNSSSNPRLSGSHSDLSFGQLVTFLSCQVTQAWSYVCVCVVQ